MTEDTHAVPQAPAAARPVQGIPVGAGRRLPYSPAKRATYGVLWAAWATLLTIAGFAALFSGQILGGLVALILAAFAGHYDYRIWTWQARRLLFFIIW